MMMWGSVRARHVRMPRVSTAVHTSLDSSTIWIGPLSRKPWLSTLTFLGSDCTSRGGSARRCRDRTETLEQRTKGSPQGAVISPLLANLFLHYAFDVWMRRRFPNVLFERY